MGKFRLHGNRLTTRNWRCILSNTTKIKIDESLIVTTSEKLAIADTIKGINLMQKFNIPVTGIIEKYELFFKCGR